MDQLIQEIAAARSSTKKGDWLGFPVAKIANTNIGFAIPVAELTRMLDGRVGALSMAMRGEHAGQADLPGPGPPDRPAEPYQVRRFPLCRPAVSVIARRGRIPTGAGLRSRGARTFNLNCSEATASATIQAPVKSPRDRRLMVQTAYRLDSGKLIYTMPRPYQVPSRPTSLARADVERQPTGPVATFAVLGSLIDSHKQPVKDCQLQRDAKSLTIEVPAGVRMISNQLDVHNAPMTLADVDGDFCRPRCASDRKHGPLVQTRPSTREKTCSQEPTRGPAFCCGRIQRDYILVEPLCLHEKGPDRAQHQGVARGDRQGRKVHGRVPYQCSRGPGLYLRLQRIATECSPFCSAPT